MSLPIITIIVPIYKDIQFVKAKLQNIIDQGYPKERYEIIFSQGGCRRDFEEVYHDKDPLIRIVHRRGTGKTYQLNEALKLAHGEIIVNTDVDALMDPGCLVNLIDAFEDMPQLPDVVGAWTYPENCTWLERVYWYLANWHRVLESRFFSASHVVAPCYAFRKSLLERFPDDVVADDVYIAWYAIIGGSKVRYERSAKCREIRNPRSLWQMYQHKNRKGNAFLRELLRFLYQLPYMPMEAQDIFFARLFQFTFLTPTILWNYRRFKQDSNFRKIGG